MGRERWGYLWGGEEWGIDGGMGYIVGLSVGWGVGGWG